MEKVEEIMSNFLLVFQMSLATWQLLNLTRAGGILQGGFQWMISWLPFCQSLDYALLRPCEGRVFKKVNCFVLTEAPGSHDESIPPPSGDCSEAQLDMRYLGQKFCLKRRDGNKLFVDEKMCYYITHAMWHTLLLMSELMSELEGHVFLKAYKVFSESVVTGRVMKFSEVLDCIILENQYPIIKSDADWLLLPMNSSLSEEKVVHVLNLVGYILQLNKVFWLIPALFTLASAVLEFNTKLRAWVYSIINRLFCCLMHLVCDKLRYSMRRQVYSSLGEWVENLKPSNDIQLKVVKGDICAPIAGGAKADREDATVVHWLSVEKLVTEMTFHCDCIAITCSSYSGNNRRGVLVQYSDDEVAHVSLDFKDPEEFMKMCTFCACVARNRSGSLKSYDDGKKKVKVRGWKESVRRYAQSGYPPIYELRLQNVSVTSI